jgi:hypothetical protein
MSEVSVAPANGFDQNTTMLALVLLRCDVAVDVYFDIAKQLSPVPPAIASILNVHVLLILLHPQFEWLHQPQMRLDARIDGLC